MTMFPTSLGHTLTGNTFGDLQGNFLSNNKTRISIRLGCNRKRTLKARSKPSTSLLGESPPIPIAHTHDLRFLRSPLYGSDLVVRDGYRIHLARYRRKVVAVKVYQGTNSAQRLEADLEINSSLFHPTILQTVAVCRATRTPFLVSSMESDSLSSVPISLGGFKSLVYYLADALSHSEQESLIAGAQLIRDVSSGLDYLGSIEQTFAISRLMFDLLVDENNNIRIGIGLSDETRMDVQADGYLNIFQRLCLKSFLEANNQYHLDKEWAITAGDLGEALDDSSYDDGDFLVQLESEAIEIVDLALTESPSREYAFIPNRASGSFSLRAISTDYTNFIRRINPTNSSPNNIQRLRHKGHSNSKTVVHRCPGYRRDEVTLGTSVSRTAVIQHLTPSLREVCPVCKQLVEDGIFNCSCGQGDDGISSTI
ncbi:hypothetical protein C8J56DRAFT_261388 [Mycena floridula]|nr:hypothetical protein C8J56DRAFT_261388 [Mycena floridula]